MGKGFKVLLTREPGGTPTGEALRQLVLHHEMDAETELMLMYAARKQHVNQLIVPALKQGVWVLSDRFEDSSFAYQASAGGVNWQHCEMLGQWVLNGFEPDFTFLFDLPVEVSFARIQKRNETMDKFEQKPQRYMQAVREGFLKRAAQYPERIHVVDALPNEQQVAEQVVYALDAFINAKDKNEGQGT